MSGNLVTVHAVCAGGAPRRPRCDLVRDAVEGGAGGVAVLAGCAALRYVPPAPPVDTLHLHQIIDYVGAGEYHYWPI